MKTELKSIRINDVEYAAEIAMVTDTMLGIEDHGILTAFIYLEYMGGGIQGAGGYMLDVSNPSKKKSRKGTSGTAIFIRRCLEVIGSDTWEKLKGNYVIALREPSFQGYIKGLMSLMNNDNYVIFEDCFKDE